MKLLVRITWSFSSSEKTTECNHQQCRVRLTIRGIHVFNSQSLCHISEQSFNDLLCANFICVECELCRPSRIKYQLRVVIWDWSKRPMLNGNLKRQDRAKTQFFVYHQRLAIRKQQLHTHEKLVRNPKWNIRKKWKFSIVVYCVSPAKIGSASL